MTNFGDIAYYGSPRYIEEDELYEEEDTYPGETDEYELWWARKRLRRALQKQEAQGW